MDAYRDQNFVPTLIASSSSDGKTPVRLYANPTTHRLLTDASGGTGTVTSITGGTGILLTPDPITTTGSVALSVPIQPIATLGTAGQLIRVNAGATALEYFTAASSGLVVGTTTITSGTTTRILYDNAGVLGEYTLTGTGTVVAMQTAPVFVTNITTPVANLSATSNQLVLQSAGVTGTLTWTPASTNKTITFPNATGTVALTSDIPAAGANTALSNLAAVAVNTTLVSDTDNTDDLGTSSIFWKTGYFKTSIELGATDTTITRSAAGIIAVEGVDQVNLSASQTLTNKTLTSPTINTATLGGATQLAEGASIRLDATLSADGTWSGTTIAGTAGTTLAFGDLIYLAVADSRWELTDADSVTTAGEPLTGICVLAAASDGDPTVILLQGNIRADANFPALTVGAPVYASTTPGDIQVAQPSGTDDVIHVVGKALTADSIYFNPSMDYITHT